MMPDNVHPLDPRHGDRASGDLQPPVANLEAEMGLLGAILTDPSAYRAAKRHIRPGHFSEPIHAAIYAACAETIETGRAPTPHILKPLFDGPEFEPVGGWRYLAELAGATFAVSNAEHYARHIRELADRRALIAAAEDTIARARQPVPGEDGAAALRNDLRSFLDHTAGDDREDGAVSPAAWHGLEVPERKWVIPDWIPDGYVTGLYGDGGTGKTLLAQMLQTACAAGRSWLGLDTPQIPTLGVYCEDGGDELHLRQAQINRHYGISMSDLTAMTIWPRFGMDNILMDFENWQGRGRLTPFFDAVLHRARAVGARLVVVDNIATVYGGEENRKPQVTQFVSGCLGRLAREIGGAVLALGHPSVAGMQSGEGTAGSVAWNAAFRSRLYFRRETPEDGEAAVDSDLRILSRKKANMAAIGDSIEMRWDDGAFETVHAFSGHVAAIERGNIRRIVLEEIHRLNRLGEKLSPKSRASSYYATVLLRHRAVAEHRPRIGRADIERAYADLLDDGLVKIAEDTSEPPSRRSPMVVAKIDPAAIPTSDPAPPADLFQGASGAPENSPVTPDSDDDEEIPF